MIVVLYLAIAFVVGYLIGNINFARIYSWMFAKKDITTVGSKNPGTMNMLRTRGFGEALITMFSEAVKAGAPAIGAYFLFEYFFPGFGNLAYFLTAVGAILGHCLPVFYKFKGGKGAACTFGMFVFHPQLWWMSLIVFVILFALFFFIEYASVMSLSFLTIMTIYATCLFAIERSMWFIPVIILLWLNLIFVFVMFRGNIKRILTGTENKINLKEKVFKAKATKIEKPKDVVADVNMEKDIDEGLQVESMKAEKETKDIENSDTNVVELLPNKNSKRKKKDTNKEVE